MALRKLFGAGRCDIDLLMWGGAGGGFGGGGTGRRGLAGAVRVVARIRVVARDGALRDGAVAALMALPPRYCAALARGVGAGLAMPRRDVPRGGDLGSGGDLVGIGCCGAANARIGADLLHRDLPALQPPKRRPWSVLAEGRWFLGPWRRRRQIRRALLLRRPPCATQGWRSL
ncbi:hypothetical protein [Cypionkella sp. TWP1-2-1b2]|uniref:hypothetical protein n=1 Tax=Cypionkella sp. TWP1-2-1b2 TaxID=2804675 RepID=UPI003CEC49E9